MKVAPIVLFTYNRLWHTQQTIESLKNNYLAKESNLYIFSDAGKTEVDQIKIEEIRNYLDQVSGFKKVEVIKQNKNLGLANSIIKGVSKIVNKYGKIIVLEDDMVTSEFFLNFMNDGLNLYENEEKVACIHGYSYPIGAVEAPYFVRGADCWGWGTWQRAWNHFREDGKELIQELESKKLVDLFNHNGAFPYFKMLVDQTKGKNDSWAIRWKASAFLKNQYTLYYKESLVQNIGNDDSGTHSKTTSQFNVNLTNQYNGLSLQNVVEDKSIIKRIEHFYKSIKPSLWQKIKAKLTSK